MPDSFDRPKGFDAHTRLEMQRGEMLYITGTEEAVRVFVKRSDGYYPDRSDRDLYEADFSSTPHKEALEKAWAVYHATIAQDKEAFSKGSSPDIDPR